MRLTEREAIDKTVELWTWLAETGREKEGWPGWEKYGGLDEDGNCDEVENLCFLCKYTDTNCEECPYAKEFGECSNEDTPFSKWAGARQTRTRKKYATLFLEQMKLLQEKR